MQLQYPCRALVGNYRRDLSITPTIVALIGFCALSRVPGQAPQIQTNFYTVTQGTVLNVAAPGVLTNAVPASGLQATLVTAPNDGSLSLLSSGGFTYTPPAGFIGMDNFAWEGYNNASTSSVAGVTIDVTPPGDLFYDNFLRSANADPLAPWTPVLGQWTIAGGKLQGTNPDPGTFSDAAVFGDWTNYSVQAEVQFPADAFAGGLDGRINPTNGAKYTVNIYPNGFPGQTTTPEVQLLKFNSWDVLNSDPIEMVTLPSAVGTNWHTLRLTFRGTQILVYFDGTEIINTNDNSYNNLPPYASGGIGAHFYTYQTQYQMNFENIEVNTAAVAANESYTTFKNRPLTVAAPGVLADAAPGIGTNLTAVLAGNPTNGSVALSANGAFTYTPAQGFSGTDSFTYRAEDGASTSAVATVTITVLGTSVPVANSDSYSYLANTVLTVPAPGVLGNDTDSAGFPLTAILVGPPSHGALTLNADGSFTYSPDANFTGIDTFTYEASDGNSTSAAATVTLTDSSFGSFFYDDFSGTTNLAPWVAESGAWGVAGGALVGGPNPDGSDVYESVYITNSWSDFSVQGQFQFSSASAYGGGIVGRLDPATGARYAAFIYPYGNTLNLIKFQDWQTAVYPTAYLAQISLTNFPPIGTGSHNVKLAFRGNQIAVYYDGSLVVSLADDSSPYLSGGIGADMYTTTSFQMSVENVAVDPLAVPDSYYMNGDTTLTVPAPGVLANDTGVFGANLLAALVSGPTNGVLDLNSNGEFSYTPATNFTGMDTFTYQASDSTTNLGSTVVTINVGPPVSSRPTNGVPTTNSVPLTNNVPNTNNAPYVLTPGTFSGLFYETNQIVSSGAGYFAVAVTRRATYSGYLEIGARRFLFSGKLDSQGHTTNMIHRLVAPDITVNLDFGAGTQANDVFGSVSDGSWFAPLAGARAVYSPLTNPAPNAGAYTLIFPGQTNTSSIPAGDGYGTVSVTRGGSIIFAGKLADGAKVTESATLTSGGQWPFYLSLYAAQGQLIGWLDFTNQTASDISGEMAWTRPANGGARYYPAGFAYQFQAAGSAYTRPIGAAGRILNLTNGMTNGMATAVFSGGDIATAFTNSISLGAFDHVTDLSANPLSLTFWPASGLFTGTVKDPATDKLLPFSGAVFQKLSTGYGLNLGPDQSSEVFMAP